MSGPYEEIRKDIGRGVAGWSKEPVTDDMLPTPRISRTATATWRVRDPSGRDDQTIAVEVTATARGRQTVLRQGDAKIIVSDLEHSTLTSLIHALRAAALWKDDV